MLRDSNWPLDPAFLIAKLLRKLADKLEVPGILNSSRLLGMQTGKNGKAKAE
tara:strand:- start:1101 stop:1256 length:156 start_codon:yes stop_codon:yes gene_type:complete